MAWLYYVSADGIGRWNKAIKEIGNQLNPYEGYLLTAIESAKKQTPVLEWRTASEDEITVFNERYLARNTENSRDFIINDKKTKKSDESKTGYWIVLNPPSWKPEESAETFDSFLNAEKIYDDEKCRSSINVIDSDEEGLALFVDRLPELIVDPDDSSIQQHWVWLKINTYTLDCQLNAIRSLQNHPTPWMTPLLKLLTVRSEWPCFEPGDINSFDWVFLRSNQTGSLNDGTEEQRQFVSIALNSPDYTILEGPPGSGKTTAICELIVQSIKEGKRIMLVASTHVAVDNVLERIIEWQEQQSDISKLIFPVRIGDDDKVTSEIVRPWTYQKLRLTWKRKIVSFLEKPFKVSRSGEKAREILRKALVGAKSEEHESIIENLILESSNLVCGTTIGILKHPAIRDSQKGKNSFEPFDVMILDEASKTTFSEFIVSAIHAQRWVIVGDIHQLSPYVEEQNLSDNINDLISESEACATVHSFLASKKTGSLVVVEKKEDSELLKREAEARKVHYIDLDEISEREIDQPIHQFLYADLIFGSKNALLKFEERLPADLLHHNDGIPELPSFEYAKRAFVSWKEKKREPVYFKEEPVRWSDEISWRLIRSYELRQNHEERGKHQNEINDLLPEKDSDSLGKKLKNIRRVAMPSILELLQTGFERLENWNDSVVINDGLPSEILETRFVSLKFQHRMHPDISLPPREMFYKKKLSEENIGLIQNRDSISFSSLLDPIEEDKTTNRNQSLLIDSSNIAEKRAWSYTKYNHRAIWIDVPRGKNINGNKNPEEVNAALCELECFVKWAVNNPKYDSEDHPIPWEVAILTFYKGQESLFRDRLRDLTSQKGNSRNFFLPKGKKNVVKITLCTVDRFQGHEADMVFLSFVKTKRSVGFLNSPNRLNVALTRARYQIVILGKLSHFKNCDSSLLRDLAGLDYYRTEITWGQKK
ncbi:MAG TPA: AAA domain-containing protein [bacterium]|nr:AAA domain-containing protein [bacterium]